MFKNLYSILLLMLGISNILIAQNGVISGRVYDAATKEPLIAANILVIEMENVGTATDTEGKFLLNIPVGSYSLRISLIGYTPIVKTDVIVKTSGEAILEVALSEVALEMNTVEVRADYFDKAILENNISTISLGVEEIKRSPGSMSDFQRILQSVAGVSFSTDQTNELLVRGGSPNENLTVFDGMELHSTNHYPNEFNSGGPINMINTSLVQDIQFSLGGFISKYGDKMSSVMNVTSREGTKNKLFAGQANLSMAGVGTILEGSINNGKGSWVFSARKSYIDLIAGSVGLTAIPKYYDTQFKVAYDLSSKHKLSWSGIYGNDRIVFDGVPDFEYDEKANAVDSVEVAEVNVKQSQWATGLGLRSLWSKNFYSTITLYGNNYHNDVDVSQKFTERIFDSKGKLKDDREISRRGVFEELSDNFEFALKSEFGWNISKSNKLEFGASIKFGGYKEKAIIAADMARYDLNNDGVFEQIVTNPYSELNYDLKLFNQSRSYVYVNDYMEFYDKRLQINLGLRYDYFSYSEAGNISPRFSMSYYLIPAISSINFAMGEFYQTQNYPTYGDRYQTGINRYIENSKSRHFVLGYEQVLDDGLRFTLEGYYKNYTELPIEEEFIYSYDKTFRSQRYLNVGKQKIYGIDFQLQQKLVKDLYGTISFSRMWTIRKDPRIGFEGEEINAKYDFPYTFTAVVGKRFKDLRKESNSWPVYLKYPSYLLPLSDDMEISLKWRYASGKPYTERIFTTNIQHNSGDGNWTEGSWIEGDEIYGKRYPAYHRLDLGFSSRYNYSSWNLVVTLSIQNIYNRQNIAAYQYNSDGTRDKIYQFSLLPVIGLEMEF